MLLICLFDSGRSGMNLQLNSNNLKTVSLFPMQELVSDVYNYSLHELTQVHS